MFKILSYVRMYALKLWTTVFRVKNMNFGIMTVFMDGYEVNGPVTPNYDFNFFYVRIRTAVTLCTFTIHRNVGLLGVYY